MNTLRADFKVDDLIVNVSCPHCQNKQSSPNYPSSFGWDRKDVNKVGVRGEINCQQCGKKFMLPAKLFNMMAGL